MRKLGFFAFTALVLAGFAGWSAATNQASIAAPTNSARINALQMMSGAGNLPTVRFADYSVVYEGE